VRDIDKAGMIAISLDGAYDRENLNVSIRVDNFQVLNGGDICISYDSSALSQSEVVSKPGLMLVSNVNEPGVVRISFAASDGLDNGTIASVKFDMLTDEVTQPVIKNVELYGRDAIPVNVRVKEGFMAAVPEHSELLQNYPNPFNPETWIPYQLRESSHVTIRIYSVSGNLIRELKLGDKAAGVYVSRSRSAYWDGKNGAGEQVASGVYFYTIQAGEFTATRKMIIAK
jgi:hypothetical protein